MLIDWKHSNDSLTLLRYGHGVLMAFWVDWQAEVQSNDFLKTFICCRHG